MIKLVKTGKLTRRYALYLDGQYIGYVFKACNSNHATHRNRWIGKNLVNTDDKLGYVGPYKTRKLVVQELIGMLH